jgi:signal transduction histidine kinase
MASSSIIKASSEDLLGIIRDVLDFSRLDSATVELERIPLDVRCVPRPDGRRRPKQRTAPCC